MRARISAGCGLALAAVALGFAYYLQYVQQLSPCPLCIFQRVAMAAFGAVCLVALSHGPRGAGARIYAVLAALTAAAGAAIAARHVWLLHLPADQVPACGPGLDYLIQIMPLTEVVATVLRGDASCAEVKGAFAGLSLPAWTGLYFGVLCLGALVVALKPARSQATSHVQR